MAQNQKAFRFVHASDLRLERPVAGLADVPDHLRDALIDAPYAAAAKLFALAIAEEVALVVLSGDVIDVRYTGPRGPLFLREQFEQLAAREIPVFWAQSPLEPPEAWPDYLPLPNNVYRFPLGRLSEQLVARDGEPLARVVGLSRDGSRPLRAVEFEPDRDGLFTIAVAYGEAETAALLARGIHYWALGGRHDRSTAYHEGHLAHWPGSPQGRRPDQLGAHGCTLVHVENNAVRTASVATDVVRWLDDRVVVDDAFDVDGLRARLTDRLASLAETAAGGLDLLVRFSIAGAGPLVASLGRPGAAEQWLTWLQAEAGVSRPAVWPASVEVQHTAPPPADWYDEETIRADFLRTLRQFELNADEPLGLETYLTEAQQAGELAHVASLDPAERRRVLHEAALLGIDLLSGGESQA